MRNPHPLVSIAIPTYNRAARYLPLTLDSALAQTYPEIEVIVSDNASSDHTTDLVLGHRDRRIRYFRQENNIGPYDNWRCCLQQARGNYFLLLHDDDLIDCDFVESCVKAAQEQRGAGVIRTGTRVIDDEGVTVWEARNQVNGLPLDEFFRAWFAGNTAWYMVSTLFRTKALREIGGFRSRNHMVQDGVAIALLASRHGRVDVEEVKASFRKHSGELTFANKVTCWSEDFLCLLDLMCELTPPSKRAVLRREGMRFFARLSFDRAAAIRSRRDRASAYRHVLKLFSYNNFPLGRLLGFDALQRLTRRAKQKLTHTLRPGEGPVCGGLRRF
ncbi:MAG: glycosyltransferase family 2 protein [Candidatus Binatia bacterium]